MTLNLPEALEESLRAEVRRGRFASVDEAIAEAVRLLLGGRQQGSPGPGADPVLGVLRDAAAELDEIVEDAMRRRREETWRAVPGE